MTDWIFQGKREDFDIDKYLREFEYIYWAVKHQKHQSEMDIGDRVFIWRAKGKTQDPFGLIAYGKIVELPINKNQVKYPEFLLSELWERVDVSEIKVGIKIESFRLDLFAGLVESDLLLKDDELSKMKLLTARQGTNFRLTVNQFEKIYKLWFGDSSDTDEEYEVDETRIRIRTHKIRERDPLLVRLVKEKFIKENGSLFCEVCGFDFNKIYGFSYAEAHHKKPLYKIKSGDKTKESDFAILCANCHKAIHRIDSNDSWAEILKIHNKI
jgi:hypothetical protein